MKEKTYGTALVIGRFQPPHPGHAYLFQQALQIAEKLIIGIGSANVHDVDNPFSAQVRLSWIQEMLEKEKIMGKVEKIVFLDDDPSDEIWLRETLKAVGEFDVAVSNNGWVTGIFAQAGHPIVKIPFWRRKDYEGRKIRAKMREEGTLQDGY